MSNLQTEGVSFADYQQDYMKLKAMEQDLKSALYAVHPFPSTEAASYFVVLYPDLENGEIEYDILDSNMMQLRMLQQVPKSVLLFAASLYQQVLDWSEGRANYPHSHYMPPEPESENSDIGEERIAELDERERAAVAAIKEAAGIADKQPL